MTRLRSRVRLTAKDWGAIYAALAFAFRADVTRLEATQVDAARIAFRKIGTAGMAAARRGVAPVMQAVVIEVMPVPRQKRPKR